jgi:hypothetical protein
MWQYNRYIDGLWVNYQNVNAWVHVRGLGWRKLTNPDDDVTLAMLTACTHAKADNRPVNFREVGVSGNIEIHELYVW